MTGPPGDIERTLLTWLGLQVWWGAASRRATGWALTELTSGNLDLSELGLSPPLSAIYRRVKL